MLYVQLGSDNSGVGLKEKSGGLGRTDKHSLESLMTMGPTEYRKRKRVFKCKETWVQLRIH